MHQGTLFGQSILVITHADNHDFGMRFEAGKIFFCRCTKLQNKEFQVGFCHGYERNGSHREDRIDIGFVVERHVLVIIDNVFLTFLALFEFLTCIDIVGFLLVFTR